MLETEGSLTHKGLIDVTLLPSRTVRYAVTRLKDEGIIRERFYFIDARKTLFEIKPCDSVVK